MNRIIFLFIFAKKGDMIISRTIKKDIEKTINNKSGKQIIVIYGARQVGKTTLVKEIIKNYTKKSVYFNCDYFDIQQTFSYENISVLSQEIKKLDLLVLDEAQRIKNIGIVLKILADEHNHLKIIATGSSSFELSNKISEPLTGRKKVYHLFPLSYNEYTQDMNFIEQKRVLNKILRFGLYPSVILNDEETGTDNLKEIASSYLFKDIFTFQKLKKPEIFIHLLKLLAFQTGHEVSYTELANKLRIDQSVVQKYIHLLEESFIIFRLPALKRNLRNEIGKSRKIYFWDIGIRNMIIQNLNTLDFRNDIGALWENFCISERLKQLHYHHKTLFNTYFWRTYEQKEIDYIEERNGLFYAYEIKYNPNKKVNLPDLFKKTYKNHQFKVINSDNFKEFLITER